MSHHDLFDLLADEATIAALHQEGVSVDEVQKQNIKRLYNHHVRPTPPTLATRFQRMDKLSVPDVWKGYVARHGADPTQLLGASGAQEKEAPTSASALYARALALARMESQRQQGCALKNFHYLFFYDLIRHLFPKAKHTQKGLGPVLIARLEHISTPLKQPLSKALTSDWSARAVVDWYDMGFAVNILASKFGAGSLFVLEKQLSENLCASYPRRDPFTRRW
ncbi:uncharacterized protein N0V89_011800 [Didymosphaeria variabile]|uniref:Uncharacterized protein n=1 Tax=Didymosphaeria variabile TaxID=1932322 RepID=A0A9W8XAE6_9PLEO|nr:uncharacterized protein N0V89_011800 [Didymosphaeria variabile]KAJ4345665.1 hypothetical protein N0V89_011800 [Didymosphaeria variabile]